MLNNAQIIGHLGRDPEVRYLPNGKAVANFSIATTEKWKDKTTGEPMSATEWHNISAFDRLAEIAGQYLKKGALVYVSGKIKTRKFTDAKTGAERSSTSIDISEMKMLGGGKEAAPEQRPAAPAQRTAPAAAATGSGFDDMQDSDIPF
jgi:single-strand DNA-binding protein